MASSATVPVGGGTILLSIAPTTSWGTSFTTSEDQSKMPVITVTGGGNANTLHQDSVSIAAAKNGSNVDITLNLTGYLMSGETATVTIPDGYIVDNLGAGHGTITALSVTNNSTHTQGTAYTRFKSVPVVVWALRDREPVSSSTVKIPLVAHDSWAGIDWVEFTFSTAVTPTVDAHVTNTSGNIWRVDANRWTDVFGYGYEADYWYVEIDISGFADGEIFTVNATKVHCKDGVDHVPSSGIGGARATSARVVTKRATPNVKYLDGTVSASGNGNSWATAYKTIADVFAGITSSTDIVYIAPGTYTPASGYTWNPSRSARYLSWVGDPNRTGDGSGVITITLTASNTFYSYQKFKTMTVVPSSSSYTSAILRVISGQSHLSFEDFTYAMTGIGNTTPSSFAGNQFISVVNYTQTGGFRSAFGMGARVGTELTWDVLVHRMDISGTGTTLAACGFSCLNEHVYAHDNAQNVFPPATHFDFLHAYNEETSYPATWTESTKTLTMTNMFQYLDLSIEPELQSYQVYGSTALGYSSPAGDFGTYKIASKTDNSNIVLSVSPFGADATAVSGKLLHYSYHNYVLRYCRIEDNGYPGVNDYNLGLVEGTGRNMAIYGNVVYDYCQTQVMWSTNCSGRNTQFVHNTVLAIVNTSNSNGVNFTAKKSATPYQGSGWLYRNNIIYAMVDSNYAHAQGYPSPNIRKKLLGPNLTTSQTADGTVSGGVYRLTDGSVKTSAGTNASLGLVEIGSAPYDFSPASGSPASHDSFTAADTDYIFDMNGNAVQGDAGAMVQAATPVVLLPVVKYSKFA